MILSTTFTLDGHPVKNYLGVVSAETIIGANAFRDLAASVRDFFGGHSNSYEEVFVRAKETALAELSQRAAAMGANAVIGISINYTTVGASGSMLMVTCTGTAVVV
ncbi:MAG: heavy metal-binding domain-containing protein [Bacteroidaceae bacterium]|nr:heavy metal-binding domain-containing protein [Bacteroidaceae bacterium]